MCGYYIICSNLPNITFLLFKIRQILFIQKTYKKLNVVGLKPAPPGNRPDPGTGRFPGFLNKFFFFKCGLHFKTIKKDRDF